MKRRFIIGMMASARKSFEEERYAFVWQWGGERP